MDSFYEKLEYSDEEKAIVYCKSVIKAVEKIRDVAMRSKMKCQKATPVVARLIQKEGGSIKEYEIVKGDLLNSVELAKKIAKDTTYNMAVRIVNLRIS